MAGAEPYSATGDGRGALVLHGFTGNPGSVRGLAQTLADTGLTVELPLLPGHGTRIADMVPTGWEDWSGAVELAYADLAARCDSVVVVGLSMGGLLAVWLAEHHPEIAGIAVVNPQLAPADAATVALIESMVESGEEVAPGIGSDIAKEGVEEKGYDELPLRALLSLFAASAVVSADLESVTCPVLVFTSTQDHVVDPASSRLLVTMAKGPVEQVILERSYHVATLDWDRDEIEARDGRVRDGRVAVPELVSGEEVARSLSREDVVHVARLARLALTDQEVEVFTAQLRSVLDHAADVAALDLSHLPPSSHPVSLKNVLRPDEPRPSLDRDEVLAVAPAVEDHRFRVPRIGGEAP